MKKLEYHLQNKAIEVRKRTLSSLYSAQSGHPGPSLSWTEIATTLLFKELNLKDEKTRDRFILSKGHGVATLYSAISIYNPKQVPKEMLTTLRDIDSPLQGHPVRGTLPLIDASTGSLGQGLSIGIGYALGIKLKKEEDRRVYVVLGDGECQEGQVWEAAMSASKFKLDNLVSIVDYNKFQNDGAISEIMPLESFANKWGSFGWYTQEVDGHNIEQLLNAYTKARNKKRKPSVIIANTVKGKGISFMEGDMGWHSRKITDDEYNAAMEELAGGELK